MDRWQSVRIKVFMANAVPLHRYCHGDSRSDMERRYLCYLNRLGSHNENAGT